MSEGGKLCNLDEELICTEVNHIAPCCFFDRRLCNDGVFAIREDHPAWVKSNPSDPN